MNKVRFSNVENISNGEHTQFWRIYKDMENIQFWRKYKLWRTYKLWRITKGKETDQTLENNQ